MGYLAKMPKKKPERMMTDWTAGYVADITYTYGYYAELNPLHAQAALRYAAWVAPEVRTACELGFGQGMSINLHAAASAVAWHGTDFNPAQAAFAQELAAVGDNGAQLSDQAFAEFCARTDLPDFDYIGLHGIWSWISDANRAVIVDFIRRKLKVGGVLYISYNAQPGWAAMVPMRELLLEYAQAMGAEGAGIVPRIDAALGFAQDLLATNPAFARANPQIPERLKRIQEQNRHYLAHEYFNRDWHPMSVAQMGQALESAKLQWACSANLLDTLDAINLTPQQRTLLDRIPDPLLRQMVRDFCVNQQFRKDFWVKGARRLTALEQWEALRAQRVVLVQPRAEVRLKVNGALGEADLQAAVYGPILDQLADHKPKTLAQLEQGLQAAGLGFGQLREAVAVLTGAGVLLPAQDEASIQRAKKRTERLNSHLMMLARSRQELSYLASPVTGGGIAVPRFHQLFLLARQQGHKTPPDWASMAWQLLSAQGQRLIKDGQALESAEENLAELTRQAQAFAEQRLPLLKALQIA